MRFETLMASLAEKGVDPAIKETVEAMVGNGDPGTSVRRDHVKLEGEQALAPSPMKSSSATPDSPKPDIRALAQYLALQVVLKSQEDQWGLLTALSEKASNRVQGVHILLHNFEHVLGRVVTEVSCQFDSPAVSGKHCTLTRKLISIDGQIKDSGSDRAAGDVYGVFVKDSSSNGTFINKDKLKKNGAEVRLRHGDIISLVSLPEHNNAFAFVFREVFAESNCKRKGSPSDNEEVSAGESKRIRAGKAAVIECPVSLDDVRRLQKSNEELRQQLEAHVLDSEKMRSEFRAAEGLHAVEVKELRASLTELHVQQIEDIRLELSSKTKELEESTAHGVQQQTTIEDLNHRLASAAQSRVDAEEAIRSHTKSIAELKKRLEDEFGQRQKERVEWESNLDAAVERTRMEAAEELKRHSEASQRLQREQKDIIAELLEADKENRRLADSLRMKLETERQAVMTAEEKGRRIGLQLQEEHVATETAWKRAAEFEMELRKVSEQLESEKAGRETAGAKISSLEQAMETAIRELSLEKQRLQGARERIVLRETQLRAFYSTAAQVEALQQKQQKQLKLMLRALEDGDGDGDYSQCRKSSVLGQNGLGDRTRVGSPSCKITSSSQETHLQTTLDVQEKEFLDNAGSANGLFEKKASVKSLENCDQKGEYVGCDWNDGDTQQEDEDGLVVSNFPSSSKPPIEGGERVIVLQNGGKEGHDNGAKIYIPYPADTQFVEQGVLGMTQLVPDNGSEENDSSDKVPIPIPADTLLHEHGVAGMTQIVPDSALGGSEEVLIDRIAEFDDRRTSRVDPRTPMSIDAIDDTVPQHTALGSAGTILAPDVLLQVDPEGARATVENEIVTAVTTPNLSEANTMTSSDDDGRNCEPAIGTQDLMTSEVLSSWAFGTQEASVHAENEYGSTLDVAGPSGTFQAETQLEGKDYDATMCTDDLLASETVGSWAQGTPPASVHADNESSGSDRGNDQTGDDDDFGRLAIHQGMRPPANAYRVPAEAMQFADPVNSQNSLAPATTIPVRNDRAALSAMLEMVEPGFGSSHGLSSVTRPHSDIEDSTTDDDGDEDENERSDASQPMSTSPSVPVR